MEVKKSPKADLENKKMIFTEIGLIIALAAVLFAFEWTSTEAKVELMEASEEVVAEEEMVPITTQDAIKPPPPPPPPPPVAEEITLVDNDAEIVNDFDFNTEANEETVVEIQEYAPVVEEEPEETNEIFLIVEEMPSFPGGETELRKYLAQEVKYPVIAQENGIQGRVFVRFVIAQDGSVTNVEVARPFDPSLDKEAVRVVKSMPKWKPGKQRGKAVRVSYTVPINFVLQ